MASRSNERSPSPYAPKGYVSPIKAAAAVDFVRSDPHATAVRIEDLLAEIDQLKADREFYMKEADMERVKNRELEDEFHVLRSLIHEQTRPIGQEENLALRSQLATEREMRV